MAEMRWEHAAEARAALNAIVTDPEHGVAALSSPRTMSNLLKDLLPDAPREKNLLVAAAEAGLADTLREHISQGMDSGTAIRLTASSFSATTPLTPDACTWVTGEIALALGISETNDAAAAAGPAGSASAGNIATKVSPVHQGYPPNRDRAPEAAEIPGSYSPAPQSNAPAPAGYSPGSAPAGYSPGYPAGSAPAGYSPGSAPGSPGGCAPGTTPGFSPGSAPGYPPGSAPAGYSPGAYPPATQQQGFGPAPGIGYPAVPVPGPMQAYQPVPMPGQPRRSNALAVTSLVLGLAQLAGWIIFLLPGLIAAVLAIVFGFVSMRQIKRSGERGRGLAITGVVLGFLGIVVVSLLIAVGVAAVKNKSG